MSLAASSGDATTPLTTPPPANRAGGWAGWLRGQWQLARRARLEYGWASLRGATHARNQDAVLAAPPLFAVADGVGGGRAGELASSQLLDWCRTIPPPDWRDPGRLAARLAEADAALAASVAAISPGGRSAATFAAAWLAGGRGHVAHVGDVRVLQLRPRRTGWRAMPLTVDQSYANLGEAPPPGGRPDDPARMVGVGASGQPPVARLRLRENDWLVLCSDGLHRWLPEADLGAHCQASAALPLPLVAEQLAQLAARRGSPDDISVLLLRRNPPWGARAPFRWAAALTLAVGAAAALIG
ncbi:SpoIIE family protein phosphatase [Ramlibacter sp. AW1]|uniref:SpoIIE family protein phosphatase n=1 Tax=Ramlibacter aurantiacus TaxID=2801330 RepID=A0A937D4Y6_9BURK|nr:SpoIIE family protein phosphatase [Ramlibacter aurantiacus]MBL0419363.1 SpoIIE family protein phosphatase [Ramlibacter aurantiacus]